MKEKDFEKINVKTLKSNVPLYKISNDQENFSFGDQTCRKKIRITKLLKK